MPWRSPEYEGEFPSLGWVVADFIQANMVVPLGSAAGAPLVLTDEQLAFLVRLYRIDVDTGLLAVRTAQLRRSKGWGKSPLVAGLAVAELCGPVRPDGWDAAGEPVGRPVPTPRVQICGIAEDQVEANTWGPMMAMVAESRLVKDGVIDVMRSRVDLVGGTGVIECVTAEAGTREGQPVTCAIEEETHLWRRRNRGIALAATLQRNVGKTSGLVIEATNAYTPGTGSVAEATADAVRSGTPGVLIDTIEGPDVPDPQDTDALRSALKIAYGDSNSFVDIGRIMAEYRDPRTDPADAARFFLNRVVAAGGQAVNLIAWDECGCDEVLRPGDAVALGFDGARHRDSTGLVATRITDGLQVVLNVWERPTDLADSDHWEINAAEVDVAIANAFDIYAVLLMFADPPYWQDQVDAWAGRWPGRVIPFHTNRDRQMVWAVRRWLDAIATKELRHTGDPVLRSHVGAAQKRMTTVRDDKDREMFVLTKISERSTEKIDLDIAAVLSWSARAKALKDGLTAPEAKQSAYDSRGLIIL